MVDPPYEGVRYAGPNFQTPRQFTTYLPWKVQAIDPNLFLLPQGQDCEQPCPNQNTIQ